MSSYDYDAVIVGAGPAGATAALYGERMGLKVLLVDKKTFPRDKICGDAISGKSIIYLRELGLIEALEKSPQAFVDSILFSSPKNDQVTIAHGTTPDRVVFTVGVGGTLVLLVACVAAAALGSRTYPVTMELGAAVLASVLCGVSWMAFGAMLWYALVAAQRIVLTPAEAHDEATRHAWTRCAATAVAILAALATGMLKELATTGRLPLA